MAGDERAAEMPPYSVLVTGATGFIGSRLAERLASSGLRVLATSRRTEGDRGGVRFVRADAFDRASLERAMRGVRTAYYLIHSMEGGSGSWRGFAARERVQAENFARAAAGAGVGRIIYLGGLARGPGLSPHMQSRADVGRILASTGIPVTELRASIIIGAQGGSYAMLRYLVERLRIMVCPSWVGSLAQPIAVGDVVSYLAGCLGNEETAGMTLEIGGPEAMSYERLMRTYAGIKGRRLWIVRIPFLTTRLSSYWVDLVTPVRASLARPLVDSLVHDTTVADGAITRLIPLRPATVAEAIRAAEEEAARLPPADVPGRTGLGANQRAVQACLVLLAITGTSYYWLDGRPEVYHPAWLAASALWYAGVALAVLFVHSKTRLGYVAAGLLSWAALAAWSLDSWHVVFGGPLLAPQPDDASTVRNAAGVAVAAVAVAASHNLFHKAARHPRVGGSG